MYIFKLIKEYIRRIVRNYKIYSITILGMSIAIIASFHIYFFVQKEYSVDAFHTKKKEIYRVLKQHNSLSYRQEGTVFPLGSYLKENLPEVKDFVRTSKQLMEVSNNEGAKEVSFLYVDPTFFELFDFPLIQGSVKKFKENPNSIILSQKVADSIFPNQNPIGKLMNVKYKIMNLSTQSLEVVGVMKNIPKNSTIQGDFISTSTFFKKYNHEIKYLRGNDWSISNTNLYLYLPDLIDKKELTKKIETLVVNKTNAYFKKEVLKKGSQKLELQRFDKAYLNSEDVHQPIKGSNQFVIVLLIIGFITLFLATTNYIIMNLGLNLSRVKEFNVKRYLGATKAMVFVQLLLESIINVTISFGVVLLTFKFLERFVIQLIGSTHQLSFRNDYKILIIFFLLLFVIAIIIALLEFTVLYKPVFSTKENNNLRKFNLKNGIITLQLFVLTSALISVFIVKKQLQFIQQKDLGFDIENTVAVAVIIDGPFDIRNALKTKSYIQSISYGDILFRKTINLKEVTLVSDNTKVEAMLIQGDANYLEVHKMSLIEGKNLNKNTQPKEYTSAEYNLRSKANPFYEVLVNEEFVRKANLKNPVGTFIYQNYSNRNAKIVGVFKDVVNTPFYNPIKPIVVGSDLKRNFPELALVNINPANLKDLESFVNNYYKKYEGRNYYPENLVFKFDYKEIYQKELFLINLLEVFAGIVLIIAVLGLIAISLFITQNRTKEIGIRKINGATIGEVLKMLNKSFVIWVAIAFVFAAPISYIIMQKWLQNFAFKTALSWWIFALAGLLVLIIALLAVSWQTYKAATQNPVNSLRDD